MGIDRLFFFVFLLCERGKNKKGENVKQCASVQELKKGV